MLKKLVSAFREAAARGSQQVVLDAEVAGTVLIADDEPLLRELL